MVEHKELDFDPQTSLNDLPVDIPRPSATTSLKNPNGVQLLRDYHRTIHSLIDSSSSIDDGSVKKGAMESIIKEITVLIYLEEAILYPVLEWKNKGELIDKCNYYSHLLKVNMQILLDMDPYELRFNQYC